MFQFVFEKMIHKKWMMICLLIGNVLLIGIAVCNPMYYHAALDKMIQSEFVNVSDETGKNAAYLTLEASSELDHNLKYTDEITCKELPSVKHAFSDLQKKVHLDAKTKMHLCNFPSSKCEIDVMGEKKETTLSVAYFNQLKKHAKLISGEWFGDESDVNQVIPCVVNEKTLVSQSLMIGQEIDMNDLYVGNEKKNVRVKVVGAFAPKENDDYWLVNINDLKTEVFISDAMYKAMKRDVIFSKNSSARHTFGFSFDPKQITSQNISEIKEATDNFKNDLKHYPSISLREGYSPIIKEYLSQSARVQMTMWILQVPVLILLAAFIFMVARQMLSMEENEIAILKSRGVSRFQIILIYLVQSFIIVVVSSIFAIPLGYFLCRVIGAANSFMEFVSRASLHITFTFDILWYWIGACVFSVAVMVIPVLSYSKLTIVEYKQNQKTQKKPLWSKMFLDFILLAIAGYTYYSYTQQKETLMEKISNGGKVDPMLLLSSTFFILGCGLLAVRILPYIVKLIYFVGKKHWKPALYASFLQIIRTSEKQAFITVFLILTITFGIFNATMARTINLNAEAAIQYDNGADLVIEEHWESNMPMVKYMEENCDRIIALRYTEPDYNKYLDLKKYVKQYTKVYKNEDADCTVTKENKVVQAGKDGVENLTIMGVEPKKFGETAWFRDDLSKTHWYNLLNKLAEHPDGLLVSRTLQKQCNLEIGDTIRYGIEDDAGRSDFTQASGKVVGFIDYWPTMPNSVSEKVSEDKFEYKDNYYIVGDFDNMMSNFMLQPYYIFMKTDHADKVYNYIQEHKLKIVSMKDTENDIIKTKNNPIYQASNGLLTISFIVVLILCMTGFLIYWILSIRSRELLFGIYRAMGLSKKELFQMLLNEHIFSTVLSILIGVGVGVLASKLFVPMIEITYSSSNLVVPMIVKTELRDIVKLGIAVLAMIVACITVLSKILSKMNISQALKLGED